jgi:hypothetical protein
VLPSSDVDHDVERLDHERPDDIARGMGHDLEVRSAAWPIIAASVLVPATALWMARGVRTHGWPVMSEFEASLALHAKALALIGVAGAVGAIAMTRKATRLPAVGTVLTPLGLTVGVVAIAGFAMSSGWAWLLCGVAVVVAGIGMIARTLHKERALLEVDDPAAGSELFTIRGMLREIRSSIAAVRAALGQRVSKRTWILIGAATLAGTVGVMKLQPKRMGPGYAQVPLLAMAKLEPAPVPINGQVLEPYQVSRIGGKFVVEATLDHDGQLDVPMTGFQTLPLNWRATLAVELASPGTVGILNDSQNITYLSATSPKTFVTIEACSKNRPLVLHLQQEHAANQKVMLYVVPTLTVATCALE